MPLFGISHEINLSSLEGIDDKARLSVQQKNGKNVIIASKGTFSDWCYDIWASWNPNKVQNYLQTLRIQIVEVIELPILTESLILRDAAKKNLQKSFCSFADSSGARAISAPLVLKFVTVADLKKSIQDSLMQEVISGCPDQDLAEALFHNQFRVITKEESQIATGDDPVTQTSRELQKRYTTQDRHEGANANSKFNSFLRGYSPSVSWKSHVLDVHKQQEYRTLGQMIHNFRTKYVLHTDDQSDDSPEKEALLESKTQVFNRRMKSFLDQHPGVTSKQLNAFLNDYKRTPKRPASKPSEPYDPKRYSDICFVNRPERDQTELADSCLNISQKIARLYETQPRGNQDWPSEAWDSFLDLLCRLSNEKTPIFKNDGKSQLTSNERAMFIKMLLKNSTIFPAENHDEFDFVCKFGRLMVGLREGMQSHFSSLLPEEKEEIKKSLETFQKEAQRILQRDDANWQIVRSATAKFKKYMEEYQIYEREVRANNEKIIEANQRLPQNQQQELLTIEPMKRTPDHYLISNALLEPMARTLIQRISSECSVS